MSLNKCFLIGNLTRDPELRKLSRSGTSVCDITIAVNRKNGDREETAFVDVTIWGKVADNCSRYLSKGSQVLVEGYLKQESWEDRETGSRRSKLKIVAESVQFLSSGNSRKGATEENRQDYKENSYSNSRYSADDRPDPRPPTEHDVAKGNGYQPQPNDDDIPF